MARHLRQAGDVCILGLPADAFEQRSAEEFGLSLDDPEDIRSVLDAVVAQRERLDAVVYLSLPDGPDGAEATPERAEYDCARLLNFVQAAARLGSAVSSVPTR